MSTDEKLDFRLAIESLLSELHTLNKLTESKRESSSKKSTDALATWKVSASISLHRLKDALDGYHKSLDAPEQAQVVFVASTFVGHDDFTDNRSRALANECLNLFVPLDTTTASCVLLEHLKPVFQSAVHPGVRQDTGRTKKDPVDLQDMYDDQPWKTHGVGSWNVLTWVLSHLEPDSVESLWPLVIPPLLTLVDDYEPIFKIKGIEATGALLHRAPASLLRRTGIDKLLFKALRSALQNLTSDQSPDLLRAAMPCYLALTNLVFPDDSLQRFERLCELVTDIIVPGWLYASSRIELMTASAEVLSLVVQALGIGSSRFLKALIPQLTENIIPKEFSPAEATLTLKIESAKSLLVLMKNAEPRIPYWRHRILDAILRCWVDIHERTISSDNTLRDTLLELFAELLVSSSDLLMSEIYELEQLDGGLFSDLLVLRIKRI